MSKRLLVAPVVALTLLFSTPAEAAWWDWNTAIVRLINKIKAALSGQNPDYISREVTVFGPATYVVGDKNITKTFPGDKKSKFRLRVRANEKAEVQFSINSKNYKVTLNGLLKRHDQTIQLELSNTFKLTSVTGKAGTSVTISVTSRDIQLPPDPIQVASQVDATKPYDIGTSTAFIYSGSNPIQTNVVPGTIRANQVAVLRGKVIDGDGNPLFGVNVEANGRPEYGETLTRANGEFDFAVNAGSEINLVFSKAGYLRVQRKIVGELRDYRTLGEEVAMIESDDKVSRISAGVSAPAQIATANPVSDASGTRTAAVFFPPATSASLVMPDGSTQAVNSLSIRATEFTVGQNGQKKMPAPLPPTSAYTYAVALNADEAIAVGATSIQFSKPVYHYVENFLGFPVGTNVPVGWLDESIGTWVASENGKVIRIISSTGGLANVDLGAGRAATTAEMTAVGMTADERRILASTYTSGTQLWRSPIKHFSIFDTNWTQVPFAAQKGLTNSTNPSGNPSNCGGCAQSSVIQIESQVLGESVPIAGTSFSLNYSSARVFGGKLANTLRIPVTTQPIPDTVVLVDVEVAGRRFEYSFTGQGNQILDFSWDGKDAYGRTVNGSVPVFVALTLERASNYVVQSGDFTFGTPSYSNTNSFEVSVSSRAPSRNHIKYTSTLGTMDPRQYGLNGWTIDVHHAYDFSSRTIHLGSGGSFNGSQIGSAVSIFAGNGTASRFGDGGPATAAGFQYPNSVAVLPNGTILIPDGRVIRQVTNGIVSAYAGYSGSNFNSSGPLSSAAFRHISNIVSIPNGDVYVADSGEGVIRRISNGNITLVAGHATSSTTPSSTPIAATSVNVGGVQRIAVANDGTIFYFTTSYPGLHRISTDGRVTRLPDTESIAPRDVYISGFATSRDGRVLYAALSNLGYAISMTSGISLMVPAADIPSNAVVGIAVDSNDFPHFTSIGGQLYKVVDNLPAQIQLATTLDQANFLTFLSDGSILVAEENVRHQVRRIATGYPTNPGSNISIASPDGSEIFDFDGSGVHTATRDSLTNATVYSFGYDSSRRLVAIRDRTGNTTSIIRDSNGVVTGISSADNVLTTIRTNINRFITDIVSPTGATHNITYVANTGVLSSFSRPGNKVSSYQYDNFDRLIQSRNANNGTQQIGRTKLSFDTEQVRHVSAGGVERLYTIQRWADGVQAQYNFIPGEGTYTNFTYPDGKTIENMTDGTVKETRTKADPRLGSQVPFTSYQRVRSPSGTQAEIFNDRQFSEIGGGQFLLKEYSTFNNLTTLQTYDSSQRRFETVSPEGRVTRQSMDALGRVTNVETAGILPIEFRYDSRGRLSSTTQGQRATSYAYDSRGYVEQVTDPLGRATQFNRDAEGKVLTQLLPDGRQIGFGYDMNGNLTSVTPPNRPQYTFEFDGLDQVTNFRPGGSTAMTRYTYNPDRNLASVSKPNGTVLTYNYDSSTGRLGNITSPNQFIGFDYTGPNLTFGTNVTSSGEQRLNMTYDGFLMTSSVWRGEVEGAISWAYDNFFRPRSRTLTVELPGSTDSLTTEYLYDNDGLFMGHTLMRLTRNEQSGLVDEARFATSPGLGGMIDRFSYNSHGELLTAATVRGSNNSEYNSYALTRDNGGRITAKTEINLGAPTSHAYAYDAAGRLTSVVRNGISTSYTYDENGNRTSRTRNLNVTNYTYNYQDQLLSAGIFTYTYNENGDRITKTNSSTGQTIRYRYDSFGNLIGADLPNGTVIDYVLDALHRRVGKKVNGQLKEAFVYQDALRVAGRATYNGDSFERVQLFIYPNKSNVPEAMYEHLTGRFYRVIADERGTPRTILDNINGQSQLALTTDEFGMVQADSNPGFFPFKFAGCLYDEDTRLCHLGAREYDPEVGRWLQRDPIGFAGGDSNLYGYSLNDPINLLDLDGLKVTLVDKSSAQNLNAVVAAVRSTAVGRKYYDMMEQCPSEFTVVYSDHSMQGNHYDPATKTLYVQSSGDAGVYAKGNGSTAVVTVDAARAFAHEMGHVFGGPSEATAAGVENAVAGSLDGLYRVNKEY